MYNLNKIYIRFKEGQPDSPNTFAAFDGFKQLGVEIGEFEGFGDIDALDDLGQDVGIVGFVGDIWNALNKLDIPIPEPIDYPEELTDWLGRKVWKTTLAEVRKTTQRLFIKPTSEKLFTGFVWHSDRGDRLRVATMHDETEIWVSEAVEFESEYRCFITDDELVGVRFYKGDWSVAPNRKVIESAVSAFKSSPRGYSLDFGITSDNKTLLVEANDGYALGNYGLPSVLYAKLIEARWEEMTRCLKKE